MADAALGNRLRKCFRKSVDTFWSHGIMLCKLHLNPKRITGELIKQMKLSKLALIAAIACGTYAGNVFADQTNDVQLVSCESCDEPAAPVRASTKYRKIL